jgi:hypothetical protein
VFEFRRHVPRGFDGEDYRFARRARDILNDMVRSTIRALAFAALLACAAQAQKGSDAGAGNAKLTRSKPESAPADPAWTALEREYSAKWMTYQTELQAARERSADPSTWPVNPAVEFWERAEAFADRGEVGAIRWCVSYSESLPLSPAARNERRRELFAEWAKSLPEGPGLQEVIRKLSPEASPARLGGATVAALLTEIAERAKEGKVRGEARGTLGLLLLGAGGPANVKRARELLELAAQDDPANEAVAAARGRLFQIERLQLGMPCPDFTAKDVDGVEFKLSDYKGKVVVLDFWGFW